MAGFPLITPEQPQSRAIETGIHVSKNASRVRNPNFRERAGCFIRFPSSLKLMLQAAPDSAQATEYGDGGFSNTGGKSN